MSMTTNRLRTYWTAEEADTVIEFLDELRDILWESYGEQIIEMRCNASPHTEDTTRQTDWIPKEDIDF